MVACDWFFNINLTQVLIPLGKRASVLAAKGTVDIILRVVVNTSKDTSVCAEEILLFSHVILTKVGPKGKILVVSWCCRSPNDVTFRLLSTFTNTHFGKRMQNFCRFVSTDEFTDKF